TAAHGRAELIRAVLEGVALSLREGLEIMQAMDIRPQRLALSGGGARGNVWPRIQCDVLGLPCVRWGRDEGAAYGAALLAIAGTAPGAGGADGVKSVSTRNLRAQARWTPIAERQEAYNHSYTAYRECYPRLKELFPLLAPQSRCGAGAAS
ncbi:MAG: FGGY-family carbohydrate kinase, partial [Terriglobales bacterium]